MRCCMLSRFGVLAVARDELELTYVQVRLTNQATAVQAAPGDIEAGCFLSKMSTGGNNVGKFDCAHKADH
jgi:hypothetical protein